MFFHVQQCSCLLCQRERLQEELNFVQRCEEDAFEEHDIRGIFSCHDDSDLLSSRLEYLMRNMTFPRVASEYWYGIFVRFIKILCFVDNLSRRIVI
jgi:hypothetical protein